MNSTEKYMIAGFVGGAFCGLGLLFTFFGFRSPADDPPILSSIGLLLSLIGVTWMAVTLWSGRKRR